MFIRSLKDSANNLLEKCIFFVTSATNSMSLDQFEEFSVRTSYSFGAI